VIQYQKNTGDFADVPGARACIGRAVAAIIAAAALATLDLTITPATAADQSAAALPASPTADTQRAKEIGELQEVVVTAERRQENLQTTAISATVLNSDQLVQKGVITLQDLQGASPSLSITPDGLTTNFNIRGIGLNNSSPSVVPGVAVYRDGVWQSQIVDTDTLYDIASVQVLRGPQGTFVGDNSTGGAIFIDSRNPDFDGVHGYAQLQEGNYSDTGVQGAVNLPINDAWAARVATDAEDSDSFYRDIGSPSKVTPGPQLFGDPGSLDERNFRVGLLGKPTDDLTILLKVEDNNKSTGGYAYRPVPGTEYAPYASANPFTLDYDTPTQNKELGLRPSLRIDWNIDGSGIDLRSITADQYLRVHNIYDSDGTDATLATNGVPSLAEYQAIIERTITQEFDLISPSTGRLQWIAGTYYLHDVRELSITDTSQAIPALIGISGEEIIQSAAAFGQVSYEILPSLQLQAGLRYTHDWDEAPSGSNATINLGIPGIPDVYVNEAGIETDSATTGKVALNWTLNRQNFLYALVAKGFKGGGFNAGAPETTFAPEVVWDYEIGWKGQYFDDHLSTSLDGFWNDYDDMQLSALNPATGSGSLVNTTGTSVIKGFEAELHGRFGGLGVDMGAGYVNSRLGALRVINTETLPPGVTSEELPQCAAGQTAGCFDYTPYMINLANEPNPYAPEWTFNAGVQYAMPIGQSASLTPRVNYSYVGSQWTTLFDAPVTDCLRSYGLWNATLTYDVNQWSVQAYGLNLADKVYVTGQLSPGANPDNEFFGNPRQFGIRVSRKFGSE
jgi:iron complex outermembrane recepter protein